MIWHIAYLVVLVYIARKLQQLCRHNKTPWWYELGDPRQQHQAGDVLMGELRNSGNPPVSAPGAGLREASVNAATDASGVLRIVATEEYEALRGAGIGAPYPGEDFAYLYGWADGDRVFYRASDEAEWVELVRPVEGESVALSPGSSIRVDGPVGIELEMW